MHPSLGRRSALLLALASPALLPLPAAAHAVILDAAPAPGTVLHASAVPVRLRFNSRIDHERSRLTLVAPDGVAANLKLDPDAGPDTLATSAQGLAPGRYRLRWQVLGVDGHITRGDIPFEILP